MNHYYQNQPFIDAVNIISLILQMQNSEAFRLNQTQEHIENKIDKEINTKLDSILTRLNQIEQQLQNFIKGDKL